MLLQKLQQTSVSVRNVIFGTHILNQLHSDTDLLIISSLFIEPLTRKQIGIIVRRDPTTISHAITRLTQASIIYLIPETKEDTFRLTAKGLIIYEKLIDNINSVPPLHNDSQQNPC